MIFTEREGRLRIVHARPAEGRTEVNRPAQALGEAGRRPDGRRWLHPDYASNGWIYLGFSEPAALRAPPTTALIRGRMKAGALGRPAERCSVPPAGALLGRQHPLRPAVPVRSARAPVLLASATAAPGRRARPDQPRRQDRPRHGRRLASPTDNPFVGHARRRGHDPELRHRNPQGLAWHPGDRRAVGHRARPARRRRAERDREGQELRLAGRTYGINYDGTPMSDQTEARAWTARRSTGRRRSPSAASASTRATSSRAGRTTCSLTGLAGQQLRRLIVSGRTV